ncbi:unnamed protein product [Didymodactylos carnosus]|uniref:Uncharacterized protein n=1 Tax=Didymodactylos carnosus TaxID=1234261 RepID=A0A8S2FLQ6_9BILA|nr:unnamed protein product [Didymodactylos carnosus]CAF4295082.1 unnamed protein product [Didymodactylos carnosus]
MIYLLTCRNRTEDSTQTSNGTELLLQYINDESSHKARDYAYTFNNPLPSKMNRYFTYCIVVSSTSLTFESAITAWFQLFTSLYQEMKQEQKQQMLDYCRERYKENFVELKNINEFEATYESSNTILKREMREDDPRSLFVRLTCYLGDYKETETNIEQLAYSVSENCYDIARYYLDVGRVFYSKENHDIALKNYFLALQKMQEKHFEIDKSSLLFTIYHSIGKIYLQQNRFDTAVAWYTIALKMKQTHLPLNHPSIANSYSALGVIYQKQNKLNRALYFYKRAVDIELKVLPCHSLSIASTYTNIASFGIHV